MNNGTEQLYLLSSIQTQPPGQVQKQDAMQNAMPRNLDNVQDFSNVCRICATITQLVVPIFAGEGLEHQLADKIHKHLPVKVAETDQLPLVVCYQCVSTLMAWHELVECSVQADRALKAKIGMTSRTEDVKRESHSTTPAANMKTEEDSQSKDDSCALDVADEASNQSDDKPLSTLTSNKSENLYTNFYRALVEFRNHFVDEHKTGECYPDFTDSSSASEVEETNLDSYDDLTQCNMRKDIMDMETRLELSQVQTKINGKVFYTCRICSKNLSSTHTYLFHKRIHTGERPCVCHICGKQFRAPNGLQRHLTETHERLRRYTCNLCSKNFANSQNLKQHFRIHTGERPFVCTQCGKTFTQSGSLHVHLKTHTEQFPYHCAECGAKFRLRSGLARHRLKHTGERPHVCAHCGKGFRQRHELTCHTLSHSDSKPFACTFCGTAFRQRRALRHHMKRIHEREARDTSHTIIAYNHVAHY